jgi:hypothetical protein
LRECLLEGLVQRFATGGIAAAARVRRLSLVAADEDVFVETGHGGLPIS